MLFFVSETFVLTGASERTESLLDSSFDRIGGLEPVPAGGTLRLPVQSRLNTQE